MQAGISTSAALHGADRAAEAGRVEHEVVVEIVVEILLRLAAVSGVAGGPPELLVLVAADAPEHRGDAAAEMRHVHGEAGWRSNTPELIRRMVAMMSENSRPTERAVS